MFSHCRGTNTVAPLSTAAIAGFANSPALQYHCTVSNGSIGTPDRSPCGTACRCGSTRSKNSSRSISATIALRAANRSIPSNEATNPLASETSISASVTRPSRSSTDGIANECRRPTSKSLKSCAGVIFTAPVPFSGSLYASATIGNRRPVNGCTTIRPTRSANRASSGCTATAVSPSIVSGRVVATTITRSVPSTGYRRYQSDPATSTLSTSRSLIAD